MNTQKNDDFISNYIEARLTKLETTQENVNQTLKRLESKIDLIDSDMKQGFSKLDNEIKHGLSKLDDDLKLGLSKLDNRIWNNFYWTIASFASVFYLLAKLLKWIP